MQQVYLVVAQNAVQLEVAVERKVVGMRWDCNEVGRQRLDVAQLAGNAKQKVFVAVVEPGERANRIAGVGAHTEFVNPPDVDGDAHSLV